MLLFSHLPRGAEYAWLVLAAFIGGVINSVAGGGGFLVFPSLMHAGIAPVQANATNTVALWPGQFTSIAAYRREALVHTRLILPCVISAVIGGVAGAWVLLHTAQGAFFKLIPWLFLAGAIMFSISGPVSRAMQRRSERFGEEEKPLHPIWLGLILTVVCFYIGYFGAGAGFITMTVLSLFGVSKLAEINALKVITTTVANGVAVISFIIGGAVAWHYCAAMMIACAIGGYVGAHNARKMSDRILRPIVTVFAFLIAGYFFWKQAHA
ncbi:MAG TPA: sulfite exporter TauE/SafE family protein [Acidobacteriaceae bacterium]|jgi:uncharacterized membrane protein YfcA|nr:sulfite exporter TauE/SafE family protein [Acidobacteriaceae bacterium]